MRLSSAGNPMIYRSRYLDRMLFSPLGYRQERRPQPSLRLPRHETRNVQAAQPDQLQHTHQHSYAQGRQPVQLSERATYLSSRELREVLGRCEAAITSGQAQIEDYEAFVICQQELGSRA